MRKPMQQYLKSLYFKLLFLTILSLNVVFGQSNYLNGYYISTKNDTIQGQILSSDWEINPIEVLFKDKENKVLKLNPTICKGFGIPEKEDIFKSKNVISKKIKPSTPFGTSPFEKSDTAFHFLKSIVKSEIVNLYLLKQATDNSKKFYIEKDNEIFELENHTYVFTKNYKEYVVQNTNYKTQLQDMFKDCPSINTKYLKYTELELIKTVLGYCEFRTGKKIISKTEKSTLIINAISEISPQSQSKPFIGIGAKIVFPRRFRNNYFEIDILPTGQKNLYNIKYQRLRMEMIIGKGIGLGKIRPFVGLGAAGPYIDLLAAGGINFNNFAVLDLRYSFLGGSTEKYYVRESFTVKLKVRMARFGSKLKFD